MTKVLTDKDRELIALLRVNAREPVASLARKLSISRTTVQDRLRRLEQTKVIEGYALRLTDDAAIAGIRAFVTVEVEPKRTQEVVRALVKVSQLVSLHTVSGKYDLIAVVGAANADELDKVLDRIGEMPGVTGTESSIILSTKLDRR
jgi:DNA-binding Lrp family transcriptional regulator